MSYISVLKKIVPAHEIQMGRNLLIFFRKLTVKLKDCKNLGYFHGNLSFRLYSDGIYTKKEENVFEAI